LRRKLLIIIHAKPRRRILLAALISAFALATAAAAAPRPALAAAPAGAGTAASDLRTMVGSCDSQKLLSDYKGGTRAGDEVRDFATSVRRTADQLRTNGAFLLPEAEARELTTLLQKREMATIQKKQITDDEKRRIGALETKAQQLSEEMSTLQNTVTPTDAQRARLTALSDARSKGASALQGVMGDYEKQLDDRQKQVGQRIVDDIRAAIGRIAKARGLVLVLDGALALYASNDITADVLKELNK
jgi:Skp family chaperone for outer membrane proteins